MHSPRHIRLVSIPQKADVDPEDNFQQVLLFRMLVALVAVFKRGL